MSHTRLLVASWSLALLCSNAGCDADKFTLADGAAAEDDGGGLSGDGGVSDGGPTDGGTDGGGAPPCGNGTKDDDEMCDPGADLCCNATCDGVREPGATCRASTGACDAEETCNGTSVFCPVDETEPATTVCRPVAGPCDVAESCTGSSGACPADGFAAATTECRDSTGTCDAAENCSGTAAACPADAFAPTTTECRASTGACDPAEHCTGNSLDCPAEQLPCTVTALASTVPQTVSGTTLGGCNADTPPVPACTPSSDAPDTWFSFTAPAAGNYVFSVDAQFDSVVYALDGASCGGTQLACDDDAYFASSQILLTMVANASVAIAVDGYSTNSGDFDLAIAEWTCDVALFGSLDGCHCGCGVVDPDCNDRTAASCDWCGSAGTCNEGGSCGDIRPEDNSTCRAWTCDPARYDAADGCDCGCGIVDPDCGGATPASCDKCNGVVDGGCSPAGTCADLESADNSLCRPWTCGAFQGAGDGCDCGCGQIDPDCASELSAACHPDYCTQTGSCADNEVDCSTIAAGNNAICM
jgi:hypothetical protein